MTKNENDTFDQGPGILLPLGVIQPFDLGFFSDDFHVMAFFEGHPRYEAVEAMIRRQSKGDDLIRAILTRHDQSQIDHISDPVLAPSGSRATRERVDRPIILKRGNNDGLPNVYLEFDSYAGERVILDFFAVGEPSRDQGGLSNPGGHAVNTSLAVMWRGKSTLASPETRVNIDGVQYNVPVKVKVEPFFVAHNGFYTEQHLMGIIRAGEVNLTILQEPDLIEPGQEWIFQKGAEELRYLIGRSGDESLCILRGGETPESIVGRCVGDRLKVSEIRASGGCESTDGFALKFDSHGGFSCSVDGAEELVRGRADVSESLNQTTIRLSPTEPGWAVTRPIEVVCSRKANRINLLSTIGTAK